MVAKCPERRQVCPADVDMELVDGGFWVGVAEEEAEVDNAADGLEDEVVEMLWCVACGLDRIHCVGGAVVAHMEKPRLLSQQIERIVSIRLQSFPSIDHLSSISVENSPSPILHCKSLRQSLAKPIEVLAIELSPDLNVVVAIQKSADIGGEEDCVVGLANDAEIEGIRSVLK